MMASLGTVLVSVWIISVILLKASPGTNQTGCTRPCISDTITPAEPSLKLHNQTYLNNSIVAINDIGEGDNALLCVTDKHDCCKGNATGQGQFYYPNNSRVKGIASSDSLYRNRGPQVVRLNRRNNVLSSTGIYRCEIPDTSGMNRSLSINITAIECAPLAKLSNGTVEYSSNIDSYHPGTIATYQCNNGFGINGGSIRTCNRSISTLTGYWNGDSPSCLAITCSALPNIDNGMLMYASGSSSPYAFRATATYQCNMDYKRSGGDIMRTCVGNGSSPTGRWNGSAPTCSETVFFMLRNQIYLNNSVVAINDIGQGNNTLLCVTDKLDCCKPRNGTLQGEFYYPNNTLVRNQAQNDSLYRNRGPQVIRLNRKNDVVVPTGIYRCEIPDSTGKNRSIYINVTVTIVPSSPGPLHTPGDTSLSASTDFYTIQLTVATSSPGLFPTPGVTNTSRVCVNNTFSTINGSDPTCESPGKSGPGLTSSGGLVAGVLLPLTIIIVTVTVLVALLLWYKRKTKTALPRIFLKTAGSKSHYSVTVKEEGSHCPHDNRNNSPLSSIDELVEETSMHNNEVDREDGEHYLEAPQLLGFGQSNSYSLETFPSHVHRMHSDADKQFHMEFKSISKSPQSHHNEALRPYNRSKNRFRNIFPYDFNRVRLNVRPRKEGSDYINASYINGFMTRTKYIAAQGPLPNTVDDFWRMIFENKLPTIVMITKCFEDRRKCECYWPVREGSCLELNCGITITLTRVISLAEFSVRKMNVFLSSDPSSVPLEVTQFHYTAWPDHNVPSSGMSLVYFARAVRKAHPRTEPKHLLVHCSAGVGRTGTFIVLDTMLEKMEEDGVINIYDCLTHIRKQRVLLVQTRPQYIFLYDTLNELIACGETEIRAHNLRSVVDQLHLAAQNKVTHSASVKCQGNPTGFQKQFKTLEQFSQPDVSVDYYVAQHEENRNKNRYPSIIPNEKYRVALQFTSSGSDYINASFVHGYQQRGDYIATQGPLEQTTGDFWSMVVENQCSCIVMLCKLLEENEQASYRYWPKREGRTMEYDDCIVTHHSFEVHGDYIIRKLEVSKHYIHGATVTTESSLKVTLFHFTQWKEKEHLRNNSSLLSLIEDVNRVQMNTNNKPIVVMCNNGIGCTGVFITIHAQLERLKIEGIVDVFQFIKSARKQREGLVNSPDLYEFCHEALADYVESFETYANFKELV